MKSTLRLPVVFNADPGGVLTVIAPRNGTVAILPAEYPLRRASFAQRKGHLFVTVPGSPEIMVPRFFAGGGQTTLMTEDGVEISRHMVLLMLNLSARVQTALDAIESIGGAS